MAALLLLDWAFLNQLFIKRLQYLGQLTVDRRGALRSAAWAMFTYSPWLGVGLGQYYSFFPEFFPGPPGAWQVFNVNRGNAHAIVVQLLAEQGIFGFLAFIFLIATVLVFSTRNLTREPRTDLQDLRLAMFAVMVTWLVLGLFHHIVDDLRSLEIFFWMAAAFILSLAPRDFEPFRPGRKTWALFLCLLAVAGAFHWKRITAHPLPEHFQVGFYSWEKEPDGRPWRWMGRRALAYVPTSAGSLWIECRAPLPEIDRKPQWISVYIGNRVQRFSVDRQWRYLSLAVPEPRDRHILLRLETAYTFNPARAGGSRDQRDLGLQLREFRWIPPS